MSDDQTKPVPAVQMQQLIDAGINGFGLELFLESLVKLEGWDDLNVGGFEFEFRGFTLNIRKTGKHPREDEYARRAQR